MSIFWVNSEEEFPDESEMDPEGMIALSEELRLPILKKAYTLGIFPWYNEGEYVQWWCPDPRFVLFPDELKVSKSMQQVLRSGKFTFSQNEAFEEVIEACASAPRRNQTGTWLTNELQKNLIQLHKDGWAISCEVWEDGLLVGGLYGILLGKIFFGESMFSKVSNASKAGFIQLVKNMEKNGVLLIDCQVYTDHLASLGARKIPRKTFLEILRTLIPAEL